MKLQLSLVAVNHTHPKRATTPGRQRPALCSMVAWYTMPNTPKTGVLPYTALHQIACTIVPTAIVAPAVEVQPTSPHGPDRTSRTGAPDLWTSRPGERLPRGGREARGRMPKRSGATASHGETPFLSFRPTAQAKVKPRVLAPPRGSRRDPFYSIHNHQIIVMLSPKMLQRPQ